jgi:hypothetical protein
VKPPTRRRRCPSRARGRARMLVWGRRRLIRIGVRVLPEPAGASRRLATGVAAFARGAGGLDADLADEKESSAPHARDRGLHEVVPTLTASPGRIAPRPATAGARPTAFELPVYRQAKPSVQLVGQCDRVTRALSALRRRRTTRMTLFTHRRGEHADRGRCQLLPIRETVFLTGRRSLTAGRAIGPDHDETMLR